MSRFKARIERRGIEFIGEYRRVVCVRRTARHGLAFPQDNSPNRPQKKTKSAHI
jgi:hypothetical protein